MIINNVLIDFKYIQISFYSFMYFISFILIFLLAFRHKKSNITYQEFKDVFFILIFSSIIGGRLGHILLYEWDYYKNNLIETLFIWQGGMSFFSSMFFSSMFLYLYSMFKNKSFLMLSDFVLPFIPIGLFFGRIGNFVNNEIWGKDVYGLLPVINVLENGFIYQKIPIVLYEAFFEGFLLFIILRYLAYIKTLRGIITAVFLLLYGSFRFIVEFFKYPYSNEYILKYFTLSQVLSFVMFCLGIILCFYIIQQNRR